MGIRKSKASYGGPQRLKMAALVLATAAALAASRPAALPANYAGLYRPTAPTRLQPTLRREGDSLRVLLNREALSAGSGAASALRLTCWASYDAAQPLWQQVRPLRAVAGLPGGGPVLGAAVAAGQLVAGQVLQVSLDSAGVQPAGQNPAATTWLPLTAERLARTFVLLDSTGRVLGRPYLRQGSALRVAAYGPAQPVRWRRYPTGAAALPPFADLARQASGPRTLAVLDSAAAPTLSGAPLRLGGQGLYALRVGNPAHPLPLLVTRPDFPGQTTADELIENLLYLTSATERRRLAEAASPKRAVDDFWLTAAGDDQTVGRDLIRRYYGRVTAANELFTGHKAGWRTDRGLLYVVLGPPQRVSRSALEERWHYPAASRENGPVDFIFRARPSTLAPDNYELVRRPEYEQLWYNAVDKWRKPLSVR